jgi:hypothetical protein
LGSALIGGAFKRCQGQRDSDYAIGAAGRCHRLRTSSHAGALCLSNLPRPTSQKWPLIRLNNIINYYLQTLWKSKNCTGSCGKNPCIVLFKLNDL